MNTLQEKKHCGELLMKMLQNLNKMILEKKDIWRDKIEQEIGIIGKDKAPILIKSLLIYNLIEL